MPTSPVDIEASLQTLADREHCRSDGMLKLDTDLMRYAGIIAATRPELIVETGTLAGASASWFASQGPQVITVDVSPRGTPGGNVHSIRGNSIDPAVVAQITDLVAGRRCMVSLDSDHSAPHVAAEIRAYGPLVTVGCHLVVEDGIFGYATADLCGRHGFGLEHGTPLDAIGELLEGNPDWSRDLVAEGAYPTTHHPNGFWLRIEGGGSDR